MNTRTFVLSAVVGLLCVPLFTHAITISELQAQIESLLAQLAALQTQVPPQASTVPDVSRCPNIDRTLSRGMQGEDVKELQKFLITYGYLDSDLATGLFGALTEKAVQKFQIAQGIFVAGDTEGGGYGVVGIRTRAAIARVCERPVTPEPVTYVPNQFASCPIYNRPLCVSGEHLETGTADINGCPGAPVCVKDSLISTCPAAGACGPGTTAVTSKDSKGCTIILSCTPNTGNLIVTPSTGKAPLSVTITAPEIASKLAQCIYSQGFYGPSGNGLSVDWGEGVMEPQYSDANRGKSCTSAVQTHTYTKAGTYTIHVWSWHPGPTDAAVSDWEQVATVTVQ